MKKLYIKLLFSILITSFSYGIFVGNMKIDKNYFKLENSKNISINKRGQLTLSPEIQTVINTKSLLVFDIKKIGNYLYVATGSKSAIYKVNLSNNNVKEIYKSNQIGVSVLGYDGKNKLFFVESNILYYYNLKTHKIKKFVSLEQESKYIWGMLYINDKLYVATGEPAKILMIDEKGNIKSIFENKNENHFLAIAYNKLENSIYFGSEGQGILYRLNLKKNKVEAIYDTYEDEISSIYIDNNNTVYFCTSSQVRKKVGKDFDYTDSFKKQEKPKGGQNKSSGKQSKLKNSVYKYERGKISKIFTIDNTVFYSLIKIQDLILAGASKGYLYAYNLRNNWLSVHSKIQDEQVLKIIKNKNNVYIATGNIGKVYKIGLSYANRGEIISNVIDLGSVSKLGKITIKADTPKATNIMLYIRAGNSEEIDSTWSKWKGPYTYKNGINIGIEIGRYVQYKLILNTKNLEKTPAITYILQAFSPKNRPPAISYFNIKQIKRKKEKNKKTKITLEWNVYDADRDLLEYKIFFKKEGDEIWLPLAENLYNINSFSFDSTLLPDGYYTFKLIVSDSPTNTQESAERSEEITSLFLIDNTPPIIKIRSLKKTKYYIIIEGIIEDEGSIITKAFYSINAKEWKFFLPTDNIFDSKKEYFLLSLPKKELEKNEKTNIIFIRAVDEKENSKTIEYKIKL